MTLLRAVSMSPVLDEAGHVYVTWPRQRRCLRLNRAASDLWRRATSTGVDPSGLGPDEMGFLAKMEANGSLRLVEG